MEVRMKVAFLGLGVMGYPMAGHLQAAGFDVCVYNRTSGKADKWCEEHGGESAPTPAQAVVGCKIVMICVGNDDDVRQVVLGEAGVFSALEEGAILIDHTTASATLARELAEVAAKAGYYFLDAPVSGGQAGAENGALTVMVGGEENIYQQAKPVFDAYSKFSKLLGSTGSGQLAKMVNQICIAGAVQGLAEGLNFAMRAGLDGEALIETISKGAAGSWQMDNRHATMLKGEYEFGFAVDWMRKDLGIAFAEAVSNGAELSVAKMVDGFYEEVQKMGGARWDTSSLLARLNK
jgi:3-hydroxyisobutyrate dehydrogenase-like beta-hydroxyacid dehydrogenase